MRDPDTGGSVGNPTPASPDHGGNLPRPADPGAFGHVTGRVARAAGAAYLTILVAALAYPAGLAVYLNLIAPGDGESFPMDFVAFWAAAKLALQGAAAGAFDWPTLHAAQSLPAGAADAYFGWHYPPTFHLLIAPLGWLNFTLAFAIYTACAIAAYCFALRPWADKAPCARDLAVAAPPVVYVLATGNTSLLWAAAFLAAIHGLSRHRPARAGAFIALLTLKPQLGLLIPVALIAKRDWRTILWAILFTALLALLATAVFGPDYWLVFFRMVALTSQTFAADETTSRTMVTWYAFGRQTGAAHDTAILVQIVFSLGALAAVALLWARPGVSADLKVAGLLLATLTATAYAFQYELVLAIVAAFFLARAGVGQSPAGRAWLAALWLLPLPGWLIGGLEIAHYAAPALTLSAASCTVLALRRAGAAQG